MSQEQLWENLARERLDDVLEPEMVKQYRIRRGEQCVYMPRFGTERYLCSCGTVNPLGKNCYVCGLEPEPLTREVVEELRGEAQSRLEQEKAKREKEEAERRARREAAQKARRRKRNRRIVACSLAAVALVALGGVLFWLFTRVWIPAGHYQDGLEALEAGDLQQAHRCFTLAGDYEDAEEYLKRFYTPVLSLRTTTDGEISQSDYIYNEKGDLLTAKMTTGEVDALGQILETREPVVWVNTYDAAGRVLERQDYYGRVVRTYNELGDVTTEDSYLSNGAHDTARIFVYIYDENGWMQQRVEICSELISVNYSYEQAEQFTYDEAGRVLTKTTQANYPASVEANFISEVVNTYDELGRLTRKEENVVTPNDPEGDCGIVEEWTYDDGGGVVRYYRSSVYPGDPVRDNRIVVTTTYDEWGNLTEEVTTSTFPGDSNREMVQSVSYTFDGEGKKVAETHIQSFSDAMRQEESGYTNTAEYTYDLFGRLKESRTVYSYAKPEDCFVQTVSYAYSGDGSLKSSKLTTKWRDAAKQGYTQTTVYDANGLERSVRLVEGDSETLTEYTYAYFYFPEGHEKTIVIYPLY